MRIRTKLLLTYLAIVGLVAILAGLALPRLVEVTVVRAERFRLARQAAKVAENFASRLRAPSLRSAAGAMLMAESFLSDDALALVDPQDVVVRSVPKSLEGRILPMARIKAETTNPRLFGQQPITIPGVGQYLMAAVPLQTEGVRGFHVVMIRDVEYIRLLSRPITVVLMIIVGLVTLLALVVSAWVSRDLVGRLGLARTAAGALAEGDLSHRVPVRGTDEIAELSEHFNHMADRVQALVDGLRKSERLRRDLLVTVSHELRTPMTSIAGFAEALRDGVVKEDAKRQRYYQIIASEAGRLTRLINDVFAVAKLDAGQLEIRLQEMPVAPWLLEAAEGLQAAADSAGASVELEVTPEAERARVYGDRDRLGQVLANLVGNAFRFTPPGEPVRIRAEVDREELLISVEDNGPGLPPEEAERVFDRFFQGANRGRGDAGAGLGLAIVKSLVEAHGGTVGVATAPGGGASFWFRLKLLVPGA